jgi:hypothetical protein
MPLSLMMMPSTPCFFDAHIDAAHNIADSPSSAAIDFSRRLIDSGHSLLTPRRHARRSSPSIAACRHHAATPAPNMKRSAAMPLNETA